MLGKVYKLTAPNCEYCYIGSTYCHYASVRMAHHRQAHRRATKNYKGLLIQWICRMVAMTRGNFVN